MTTTTPSREQWERALVQLASLFDSVGTGLRSPGPVRQGVGVTQLPVLRHLPTALGNADASTQSVCAALSNLSDALCWRQNPNYTDRRFLDGYAYCELLGPSGHLHHDTISAGLLLLQPDLLYPEHAHPATETYVVLSGRSQWRQGNAHWQTRIAGELITHATMEVHAMHSGTDPLLAAYLWEGDLAQAARLVESA